MQKSSSNELTTYMFKVKRSQAQLRQSSCSSGTPCPLHFAFLCLHVAASRAFAAKIAAYRKWRWISASLGLTHFMTIAVGSFPQCINLYCQLRSYVFPRATTLQCKGQQFVWNCVASDRVANDISPKRDVLKNSWGHHLRIWVVRAMPKHWPRCWNLLKRQ